MFQSVVNFGPKGQVVSTYEGFCYQYVKNGFKPTTASFQKYTFPHPGTGSARTTDCVAVLRCCAALR
jgi:hypothetical protein